MAIISSSPIQFRIINDSALFTDIHYKSVSYRLVILHVIQSYLNSGKNNIKTTREILSLLIKSSKTPGKRFYKKGFLELYWFKKKCKNGIGDGIIIIDRTKGCYPLILYPRDANVNHGDRIWSFRIMLEEDLLINSEIYDELFKNNHTWEPSLVDELRKTFTFPEK